MKRFLVVVLFAVTAFAAPAPNLVNGIVVIVNDKVITYKDVAQSIFQEEEFLRRRYANNRQELDTRLTALYNERVEELIEQYLVLDEFKTYARPLPESYIENRINEDIKQNGGRLNLVKLLQSEGVTWESYRQRVRDRTVRELMWLSKVPPDPLISPTKIENYYLENRDRFKLEDQVQLRVIVLTNASSLSLAQEIAKKIDDGASFADMAKVYSQSSSAAQGGDMGKMDRKSLREELATAAFTLPVGKRSDPIQVGSSVFLVLVESRIPAHTRSLSEVRQEIEDTLKAGEVKRLRKQFVERLKKKAFIRYF